MHTDQWVPDFDDPNDLTPEERLAHIVRILARGAIRLAEAEHENGAAMPTAPSQCNGFESSESLEPSPLPGCGFSVLLPDDCDGDDCGFWSSVPPF